MKSPFKFLDSYTRDDRDIFFGREKEIAELYRRVFNSRIMLVYGMSGTGKSSLIHCGLASKFRDSDWLNVNVRRGENLIKSIAEAIEKESLQSGTSYSKVFSDKSGAESGSKKGEYFKKAVKNLYLDHYKPIYFIFDQFEELFIFGTKEEDESFVKILQSLLSIDLQCKFIFILREEYLGWLSTFENSITGFFDNRIRIEKMDLSNAKSAIEGPCKINNIAVEEGFADYMLQKLCPKENEVELTYLQVYLDKIFKLATEGIKDENEKITFRISDLDKAGNVYDILGSFLDEQISHLPDPELAMTVLKAFVSARGTKRPANVEEIRDYAKTTGKDIDEKTINNLLISFVNLRILQDKDHSGRNELKHDALAAKIFEKVTLVEKELIEVKQFIESATENWKKRDVLLSDKDLSYIAPYEDKLFLNDELKSFILKSKREALRIQHRRRNIFSAAGIALLIAFAGFTIWALLEKQKANKNEIIAKSNYYNALSKEFIDHDPTKALRIADYSCKLNPSEDNYQNLVDIYSNNEFYYTYQPTRSLNVIDFKVSEQTGNVVVRLRDKIILLNSEGKKIRETDFILPQSGFFDISSNEKYFLFYSRADTLKIIDLSGNLTSKILLTDDIYKAFFLPDCKKVLAITYNDKSIRLLVFSLAGEKIAETEQPLPPTGCFLASNSSDTIFYISETDELTGWIISKNQLIKNNFKMPKSEIIYNGQFISDDRILMITNNDSIRIYDLKGNLYNSWYAGDDENKNFSNYQPLILENQDLFSTMNGMVVKIWNYKGEIITTIKLGVIPQYNSISKELLFWVNNQILGYRPNNFQYELILKKEDKKTNYYRYGDNFIEYIDNEQYLVLMDGEKYKKLKLQYQDDKYFYKVPNKRGVIYHFPEKYTLPYIPDVTIYDITDGKPLVHLTGLTETPEAITFSKDGNLIISYNKLVKYENDYFSDTYSTFFNLYDKEGALLRTFPINSLIYPDPIITIDDNYILSKNGLNAILWDTAGNQLVKYIGHNRMIHSIDISEDGNYVLTGSFDKTARIWTRDGKTIKVINTDNDLFSLAFLPGEHFFQIGENNVVKLYDISGVLIQKVQVTGNSQILFLPKDRYYYYSDNEGIHRARLKEPIDSFLILNNYNELSLNDKIQFGILSTEDLLKSKDPKELYLAGNYYYENVSKKINISEKKQAVNLAENFFQKGLTFDTLKSSIARLLSDLSIKKYQFFNENIKEDIEKSFNIMISSNDKTDLLNALNYYSTCIQNDSVSISLGFPEKAISISQKLLGLPTLSKANKYRISFFCSNLAFMLLDYKPQYQNSLTAAKIALRADSTNLNLYTNLVLALVFNNMYDEAEKVYTKWKDKPYIPSEGYNSFREVFLSDIADFERRGKAHPDFERIKELLKK